ncbi:hypothetical protein M3Y99_00423500 [Aphelenchoides fujianensis]|nr:hypothetical protein M3Y99_00423500 [Aphelenchoides fujianensis]
MSSEASTSAASSAPRDPPAVLQQNALTFLQRVERDLEAADRNYKAITREIDEYVALKSFILKELSFAEHRGNEPAERKVMMDLGKNVYSRATIKPDEKLLVRVQADLFLQMPFRRAFEFVTKRVEWLTKMADECLAEIGQIRAHSVLVKAVMSPQ